MPVSDDLIRHSVTAQDYDRNVNGGGVGFDALHIFLGDLNAFANSTPGLPAYWTRQRDYALSSTLRMCSIWPSMVNKAVTKQVALGWRIEDSEDSTRRTSAGQDLLTFADATDWIQFGSRHLQDVHLCDNGVFIEVVRAANARGSRILGLMHLDSFRCTRTGYPDYPILYQDDLGAEHALRADQVLSYADMPSPRATLHGVGMCAADRAFDAIVKLASVETYFREKVTGSRTLAIHIVSGISKEKLKQAMTTADQEQKEKGFFVYKGSVVIPTLDTEKPPGIITIPLAEIPDGFDVKTERDAAYLEMVNAAGIALQDIQPLSGQGLGTGTQTVILDEAAMGMGPGASWRKWFEHVMTFRVQTRETQIKSGEITPAVARQIAADAGDLPKDLVGVDATPGGVLEDSEKPTEDTPNAQALALSAQQPTTMPQPAPGVAKEYRYRHEWTPQVNAAVKLRMITEDEADRLCNVTKAKIDDAQAMIDQELSAALALVEEILSRGTKTTE
jgi:hypothetical protein